MKYSIDGFLEAKRTLKLLFLLCLISCISCTNHPRSQKSTERDSIAQQDTTTAIANIPKWLIGTWKGHFTEAQYGMDIQFVVIIKADGRISQTSTVPGEEDEVLNGKCISAEEGILSVGFENQEDYTQYYLDKKNNKLGISSYNWLTKK
jgi:hypothetical protein